MLCAVEGLLENLERGLFGAGVDMRFVWIKRGGGAPKLHSSNNSRSECLEQASAS